MTALGITSTVLLPFGLGLLGFVEPCTIGSSLIFVKHMEGRNAGGKLAEVSLFAITRALFIGLLGVLAVALGANSWACRRRPGSFWAPSMSGWASCTSPAEPEL